MKSIKKHLINTRTFFLNLFKKGEGIDESKMKWNALAQKDAAYYIMTDKSKSASDADFRVSGKQDVQKLFLNDEIVREIIGYDTKAVVLEIGCGTGRLSESIAPHVHTLYAVDISEEMISRARERLPALDNVTFLATDGMSFPLADETVDTVFSYIVFQHMPSVEVIQKNIEGINRILKVGGIAKIQLRGIPTSKDSWFYGPSFNISAVQSLIQGTSLSIVKSEGENQKCFWVWLKKT